MATGLPWLHLVQNNPKYLLLPEIVLFRYSLGVVFFWDRILFPVVERMNLHYSWKSWSSVANIIPNLIIRCFYSTAFNLTFTSKSSRWNVPAYLFILQGNVQLSNCFIVTVNVFPPLIIQTLVSFVLTLIDWFSGFYYAFWINSLLKLQVSALDLFLKICNIPPPLYWSAKIWGGGTGKGAQPRANPDRTMAIGLTILEANIAI